MHNDKSKILTLLKKAIAILLANVIFLQLSTPAFAQLVGQDQNDRITKILEQKYSKTYSWGEAAATLQDIQLVHRRAAEIKNFFIPPADEGAAPLSDEAPSFPTEQEFLAEYNASLQAQHQKALNDLDTEEALALADLFYNEEEQEAVKQAAAQARADIEAWRSKNVADAPRAYAQWVTKNQAAYVEYKRAQDQLFEEYIEVQVRELMELYKAFPSTLEGVLLAVSPVILMLRRDDKEYFTPQEKNLLRDLYVKNLKSSTACEIVKHVNTTVTFTQMAHTAQTVPVFERDVTRSLRSQSGCDALLTNITGLSIVGNEDEDAQTISDFMEKTSLSAVAAPAMLLGVEALFTLNRGDLVERFVRNSIAKSEQHNLQIPSMGEVGREFVLPEQENYLSDVSAPYQYPKANGAEGNAWEDLAFILADQGTTQALNILKTALNCRAFTAIETNLTKRQYVQCKGIKPFLAGALLVDNPAVKSFIESYTPARVHPERSYSYINAEGGGTFQLSPAQIRTNVAANDAAAQSLDIYAQNLGVSKSAALAHYLYHIKMGDLKPEAKMGIDNRLAAKYGAEFAGSALASLNAYTDNTERFRKISRTRTKANIFMGVGIALDIALAVWAVWDLGRLSVNGIRLVRTIGKSAKMVRNGSSVMQRALMIRSMKTAKNLRAMRNFFSIHGFAQRRVGQSMGAALDLRPQPLAVDSAITGLPKRVLNLADLPKAPQTRPVMTQLSRESVAQRITYPVRRSYQEIYAGFRGVDPFAPRVAASEAGAQTFNGLRVVNRKGRDIEINSANFSESGELLINNQLQKAYKIGIETDAQTFLNAARAQGYQDEIVIKGLMPGAQKRYLHFIKKDNLYRKIPLVDASGAPLNAQLGVSRAYSANKPLLSAKRIMLKDGVFYIDGLGEGLNLGLRLPKFQLRNFYKANIDFTKMPSILIQHARKKLAPIFFGTALSFSAASSGLLAPLTTEPYNKVASETDVALITLGLPYAPSLLAPLTTGLVNKFGANRIQMISLVLAGLSLGTTAYLGYRGRASLAVGADGKVLRNEDGSPKFKEAQSLPKLWPLYFASGMAGIASAMTRSSLTLIAKKYEVGNSVVKGMLFKNVGSLAMVLPPALFAMAGQDVDFSISYPVLAAASGAGLALMWKGKFPSGIEKINNYRFWNKANLTESFRFLGNANVLPYVAGFTFLSAYEGQAYFKAINSFSKQQAQRGFNSLEMDNVSKNASNAYVALGGAILTAIPQGITRFFSRKKINNHSLALIRGITSSAVGGAMLWLSDGDDPLLAAAGGVLIGYGTANIYGNFVNSSTARLEAAYAAQKALAVPTRFRAAAVQGAAPRLREFERLKSGLMSGMSMSNVGLGAGSVFAGAVVDKRINDFGENSAQANARSNWLPLIMLGTGAVIAAGSRIIRLSDSKYIFGNKAYNMFTNQLVPLLRPLRPFAAAPGGFMLYKDATNLFGSSNHGVLPTIGNINPVIDGGFNATPQPGPAYPRVYRHKIPPSL